MIDVMREDLHVLRISRLMGGASAAALAVGFPFRSTAQESLTVEQFRNLSLRLTGAGLYDLDPVAAGKLLDGFNSLGRGADLVALAASGANTGALADDIVAAWYSGAYHTAAGLAEFNLPDALVWDVLTFTKPPALCGGPTGYWADPPQA
jgi:Membrane bound FAD containing D-sorbitol dehydrogenase